MAIQIKHQFVSLKGDGTDATQVQPSHWNAVHAMTMATNKLVGRLTAGVGAVEEIDITPYMAGLLNTADAATLAGILGLFETGDTKWTFRTTPSAGWLLMLGGSGTPPNTIGNVGSGAALRANADTFALYTIIYNGCSDAIAPVSGGRSGNATTDFNAGKTIQVPNPVGRSPVGAGAATTGLVSARTLGDRGGAETHTLTSAEMPVHFHAAGISDPSHAHAIVTSTGSTSTPGGAFAAASQPVNHPTGNASTGVRVNSSNGLDTTYSAGSGGAHANMHPWIALNVMVKL